MKSAVVISFALPLLFFLYPAYSSDITTTISSSGVIDGDTFDAENGQRVRVLNINTAEIGTERGKYAYYFARKLLKGKTVKLVKEPGKNKGRYGRYLYHVILPDGSNYATKMIHRGHSNYWKKYGATVLFDKEYKKAERYAKKHRLGIYKINRK